MKKTTIILPCGGKSTRYPNLRPKYLLVNPNGNLMLIDAISKIGIKDCRIVVAVLKEHEERYGIKAMLERFFPQMGIETCVLEGETRSQSETACKAIEKMGIDSPFLIKDADNIFEMGSVPETYNYVTVNRLDDTDMINASNKSYVVCDSSGLITNIEEKKVVSNTFSVGGYYFLDPEGFVSAYHELEGIVRGKEIYVSTLINHLIFTRKAKFKIKPVTGYEDLGTIHEWIRYKQGFRTYFIDIDGVVVKNGAEYFEPYWGTTDGIKENISLINRLYESGSQIILTTSRKEEYREKTQEQLEKHGVRYHQLVMGLLHSTRILVNDFTNSNPYPSAVAISIPRDSNELEKFVPRH